MEKKYSNKIKVFPYKKIAKILIKAKSLDKSNDKIMYVVCGPNGSGKSTIMANLYYSKKINVPFINLNLLKDEWDSSANPLVDRIVNNINEGNGFAVEWDSQSNEIIDLIKYAKFKEYKVVTYFVFTASSTVNSQRVNSRYKQGGLYYDAEALKENYNDCLKLSKKIKNISDTFVSIDNTFSFDASSMEF